jgi:hypothetical protein
MSPAEFCRELEAYLCRKNEGHLIRIVGPVFGTVTGWAEQGIPLKVAFRGIDRYFDRQRQTHKPRRRPVPIQFCEADILDAFDEWRRAVGVSATAARSLVTPAAEIIREGGAGAPPPRTPSPGAAASGASPDSAAAGLPTGSAGAASANSAGASSSNLAAEPESVPARRKTGLQTHIDRVMARLTQRRVDAGIASAFADAIDRILARLDALRADAKGVRGEQRELLVEALAGLDREMLEAAAGALDAPAIAAVRAEAARELDPFRARMAPDAFAQAAQAAADRLIRERARLPVIRVDE